MNKPTASELEILQLLWQKQPQTVKEINECINQERPTGYTTTLKIMQIMTQKRYVRRVTEGKKHLYYAELQQDDTQRVLIDKLLDGAFMGSAQRLIMKTLGSYSASQEEINEIRKMLDDMEKNNRI